MTTTLPALFSHQTTTAKFLVDNPRVMVTSDPGTGKTRAVIEGYKNTPGAGRMLVFAPLSILQSGWIDDIERFFPGLSCTIAHGKYRTEQFDSFADVVITNHDAVKWIAKDENLIADSDKPFTHLVIDESTAFKNRTSQRSKSMAYISRHFSHRILMTGTPNPNTVLDLWHQARLCDNGERLGTQFFKFRMQMCDGQQVGGDPRAVQWVDKIGAQELVVDMLKDITIRYAFEDCLDIPKNTLNHIYVDLPPSRLAQYKAFEKQAVLDTANGSISAIHAGALATKLLQMMSGAIYDNDGNVIKIHEDRYALVMELINARECCIVAFNWQHEKEALLRWAKTYKFSYGVIDGSVSAKRRTEYVKQFQNGELKVLFCHPQSASHGLTLTRGTTTIWCSPTYNAEFFTQFNRRIYRAGQTRKTETICIAARDTKEIDVYNKLNGKLTAMSLVMDLFSALTKQAA